MPNYGSRKGRGGWTNDQPQQLDKVPPRLFIKRRAADAALRRWLRGVTSIHMRQRHSMWGADDSEELVTTHHVDRRADDMEIIALKLSTDWS